MKLKNLVIVVASLFASQYVLGAENNGEALVEPSPGTTAVGSSDKDAAAAFQV